MDHSRLHQGKRHPYVVEQVFELFTNGPVASPQIRIRFHALVESISKTKLAALCLMKDAPWKGLALPSPFVLVFVSPAASLKSAFAAALMVFQQLNEINYFHILQTLRHVCVSPVSPTRVQLAHFICVANEPGPGAAPRPPRTPPATQRRGEPIQIVIKSPGLWQTDAE